MEKEYEIWKEKLMKLTDHINSLSIWDDYAEECQRRYDILLEQDPKKGNQKNG